MFDFTINEKINDFLAILTYLFILLSWWSSSFIQKNERKCVVFGGGAKGSGQREGISKNGRNSKEYFVNLKLAYKDFLLTDFSQN
jgi:hypothetical protein